MSLVWENVCLPTRENVRQHLLIAKLEATSEKAVLLFMGARGKPITKECEGRLKTGNNFLVRSSPLFAKEGFITAIVDAPSDRSNGMDGVFRTSPAHHTDIRATVDFLVGEGTKEVFLIGTSAGTFSVGYLATVMKQPNIKGYVLTASVSDMAPYAPRITDPVLMVHHVDDVRCSTTRYGDAQVIYDNIPASTRKHFITISGGDPPIDTNPCQARTAHGFLGKEREVVGASSSG